MSRTIINEAVATFARAIDYGFVSETIPQSLAGGVKYPYILFLQPQGKHDRAKRITTYPCTFYFVGDAGKRDVNELFDELQQHAISLNHFIGLRCKKYLYTDRITTCDLITNFDNSTARAIKATFNIYCYDECEE